MPSRASKRWNVPKSIARFLVLGFLLNVLVSYAIWVIAWQFYDFTHPGAQAYTQTQSIDSPGYQHERWEGQAFGLSGLWSVTNTETPPGISLREQQALLDSGAPSVTGVTLTGIQTTELIYGWPFRSIGWKSSDSIVTVFDSQLQKFETRQSKTRSPNWFFGGITLGLRWPGSILPITKLPSSRRRPNTTWLSPSSNAPRN